MGLLPAGPIQQLLRERYRLFHVKRCCANVPHGFPRGTLHERGSGWEGFADTLGFSSSRPLFRILAGESVSLGSADQIATKLGTHLVFLYPELYPELFEKLEVAS